MKVKTIALSRTRNLGNFESARADVTVELDLDDNVEEAFAEARRIIASQLGIVPEESQPLRRRTAKS